MLCVYSTNAGSGRAFYMTQTPRFLTFVTTSLPPTHTRSLATDQSMIKYDLHLKLSAVLLYGVYSNTKSEGERTSYE